MMYLGVQLCFLNIQTHNNFNSDPITSGTFQAIQSYTINDIEFDREFAPCILTDGSDENERGQKKKNRWLKWVRRAIVGRTAVGRAVKIDLDMFHETVKIGEGCL